MKKGISMISLIIIIIVIIILSIIAIYALNTPDNANFAKFSSQVYNFQTAIHDEFLRRRTRYYTPDVHRKEEHIYYSIATGIDLDININTNEMEETIQLNDLGIDVLPYNLDGTECYLVSKDIRISNIIDSKGLYTELGTTEKHYITNKGEFFVLPGYPVKNGENTRWYITSTKYYESVEPMQEVISANGSKRIIFNPNGGTVTERVRIKEEGEEIGELPIPRKEGFLFDGWYTSQEEGVKISPDDIKGNTSVTYYAHWTPVAAEVNGIPCLTFNDVIKVVPKDGSKTTVKVYSDVHENFTIDKNQNIEFDLQGHTLNNDGNSPVITNSGYLSVTNGNLNTTSTSHAVINNSSTGTVKIYSGNVISTGNRQAIYNDGGIVEIGGTAYLSSNSSERATVTNQSGGTLTVTGGTIISTKTQAISNAGIMTIGKKDGQISDSSPIIQGATYGITATSNFNYYDGIIKGQTKAIDNEAKIEEIEENAFLKHSYANTDNLHYAMTYLSFDPKEYDIVYEHPDDYVFDGNTYQKIDVNLFSQSNIHKDFSISFVIKNYTITKETQPTIVNVKNEAGSPYNGIAYRLGSNSKGLQFSAKGCPTPIGYKPLGDITENLKVLIERKNNIIYFWQNDELCYECNYSNFSAYFDVPITIGSSYKNNQPMRYFTGTLSNIIVKVEK